MTTQHRDPAVRTDAVPAPLLRPLGGVAMPVAQDRWERLVTAGTIPEEPARVWAALVTPEHVRQWLGVCHGGWAAEAKESTLDFEDGEFFYCLTEQARPPSASGPGVLAYQWRWVGIGPATTVTWTITPAPGGTAVSVVEEATNPPSDWRSWNGMGWPGIVDQLAGYLRTGLNTRWPWRRMGPYLQIPIPAMPFQAWDILTSPSAVKYWMQRSAGSLQVDDELTLTMGDASGTTLMRVTKSVDTGQDFPSYMPYIEFQLRRPVWREALGGRMWIEPTGMGNSLLQIFHHGWEGLSIADPVTERRLLTNFWVNAAGRAQMLLMPAGAQQGPHGWSVSGGGDAPGRNGHQQPSGPTVAMTDGLPPDGRALRDAGGAMAALLVILGLRLNLFDTIAGQPATPAELAGRTGLAEQYLREWLKGMAAAGYLAAAPHDGRFSLVTRPARAEAAWLGVAAALGSMVDEVAESFRSGQGIGDERYPAAFFEALDALRTAAIGHARVGEWLRPAEELVSRLAIGGRIIDVACGGGDLAIALAARFPAAEIVGYDIHEGNVRRARAAAQAADVTTVDFQVADATTHLSGPVDLVMVANGLHRVPDPEALLTTARRALSSDDAAVIVLENDQADDTAPLFHGLSVLYAVPTSLANGGAGTGVSALARDDVTDLARRAGFTRVDVTANVVPSKSLYLLRP